MAQAVKNILMQIIDYKKQKRIRFQDFFLFPDSLYTMLRHAYITEILITPCALFV